MNRFLQAAIQNMERVEYDHNRERPMLDLRQQWTQEAIAYALIAIAEHLDTDARERLDAHEGAVTVALGVHEQQYHGNSDKLAAYAQGA